MKARVYWGYTATSGAGTYYETDVVDIAVHQQWCLEVLGPINLDFPGILVDADDDPYMWIELLAKHDSNTANVQLDFFVLIPAHGGLSVSEVDSKDSTSSTIMFDNINANDGDRWITYQDGVIGTYFVGSPMGSYPKLRPDIHNRLVFLVRELYSSDYHETALDEFGELTLTYVPRTTALLGTT